MTKSFVDRYIRPNKWLNYNLGYLLECQFYLSSILKRKNQPTQRFVIFGSGRSGSTLLVSLLNSHSQIFCDNEIFHRRVYFRQAYLNLKSRLGTKPVYGFKLLTYHLGKTLRLHNNEYKEYLTDLTRQGYQIIYLRRENSFRQALSNLYARQNNQFHNTGQTEQKQRIHIDTKELNRWIEGLERQAEKEQNLLEGIPHIALTYEENLSDADKQKATLERLTKAFGLAFEMPKTGLKKNTPRSLDSFIENHEEVAAIQKEVETRILAKQK